MFDHVPAVAAPVPTVAGVRVGGAGDPGDSVVEKACDGIWGRVWAASSPEWVDRDWYGIRVAPQVATLTEMATGPALAGALHRLETPGTKNPGCPVDHRAQRAPSSPVPGRVPGWPCPCQLITAAAWDAIAGWASACAGTALVAAAGATPNTIPARGNAPGITDPALEDLAISLRISPDSARNRVAHARAINSQPELGALVRSGAISPWAARTVLAETEGLSQDAASRVITGAVTSVRHRLTQGRRALTAGDVRRAARRRGPPSQRPTRPPPARQPAQAGA